MTARSFVRRYWSALHPSVGGTTVPAAERGRSGYSFPRRYWASLTGTALVSRGVPRQAELSRLGYPPAPGYARRRVAAAPPAVRASRNGGALKVVAAALVGVVGLLSARDYLATPAPEPTVGAGPYPTASAETPTGAPPTGAPSATEPVQVPVFAFRLDARTTRDRAVEVTIVRQRRLPPKQRFWLVLEILDEDRRSTYRPVKDVTKVAATSRVRLPAAPDAAAVVRTVQVFAVSDPTAAWYTRVVAGDETIPPDRLRRPPCTSCDASEAVPLPP